MEDTKEKPKTFENKSQEEGGMISKLPDLLISDKILTHLSTKDAVRTSALSTKWRNRWQSVPGLDLDSRAFSNIDAFVDFVDSFFDSHRESWIRYLKLCIRNSGVGTESHLSSWIDAVTKRKVQQLDVLFDYTAHRNEIHMSIYTCATLVQLRLCRVPLGNVEFVSLPCLKMMHLDRVKSLNDATTVEKLISGSPVLEDLTIITSLIGSGNIIQVQSQMLKRIHINVYTEVVIDAPLLQCLKTEIFRKKNFKIISSGFLAKVNIIVTLDILDLSSIYHRIEVSDILNDVSKVRDLGICSDLWKGIYLYSKSEPLLQFHYLSRLDAGYYKSDLELLPTLLESCPNLQSLILERKDATVFMGETKDEEPNVMFSTVPQCLVSSLTYVELKRSIPISADKGDMELVRYFLKNSAILEKMKLDDYYVTEKQKYEILTMPRCSNACEVLLL